MPETNLPPLCIHLREDLLNKNNLVDAVVLRRQLPELPEQIRQRLKDVFHISPEIIIALMVNYSILYNLIQKISFNILYFFRVTTHCCNYLME